MVAANMSIPVWLIRIIFCKFVASKPKQQRCGYS